MESSSAGQTPSTSLGQSTSGGQTPWTPFSSGMTPVTPRKKMTKQLTGKRDDSALHSAARAGNLMAVREIIDDATEEELIELLSKENWAGETALYVAAEYGYYELVRELIQFYDLAAAGIKAKNGFDALHIAAKQGDLGWFFFFPGSVPF